MFYTITIIFAALTAIIILLGSIVTKRRTAERTYITELENFKNFIEALHRTSSELEVYSAIFSFIGKLPLVKHAAIFYCIDRSSENCSFQKISNEETPLCSMSPKSCPLVRPGQGCAGISINKSQCSYQSPDYNLGSFLCLSMADTGHWQSILQIYSQDSRLLDKANITKLKSYIDIAKAVLHNRRTLSVLNQKASTDRLTNVYNRTFLEPYLENQIEAANLSGQQLSILTIDIDNFKKINDTFGHQAGDHVLILFTELISKCIRKADLLARYGGDEFIVVLPSTDTDTAEVIAERIRSTVEITHVPTFEGMFLPSVSCSIGISTYPIHCKSKDELIKTSDITLYKAKQAGRNCIRIYSQDYISSGNKVV